MLLHVLIYKIYLLGFIFNRSNCFRIASNIPRLNKLNFKNCVKLEKNVYHEHKLGAISNPEEFKLLTDYIHYDKLTNFIPDKIEFLNDVKRCFYKYTKITLKVVRKLSCKTITNFYEYYENLLDEIKFWYLKGSNFSFYDLFTIGDNPVYLLTKLNILAFIFDVLFRGELTRNFSLKGMNLFYKNEHYRILTSLFLHSDLRHIIGNVGSLLSSGKDVLKFYGPANFLLIYFISGVAGNYISYLYHYVYKNGIPANLLIILRSIGRNFSNATKPIVAATNTIVDDILQKGSRIGFPLFAFKYLTTSATMTFDFLLSKIVQILTGISPASPNDVDQRVKEICIKRSKNEFTSCGASTSIFGLHGALVSYYLRSGCLINYSVMNNLFVSFIPPYILMSLAVRYGHVAHLAGFITGLLLSSALE